MDDAHTQAAVINDGQLIDFIVEQSEGRSLVGNFYKGIVQNVLPGMQAAFIDIGLIKNAFIYVDDLLDPNMDKHPNPKPTISQVTYPGQQLIVQVVKDPIGNKGARVTTHYNLAGRWLVYMPSADYIGVSKKVADEQERERLKLLAGKLVQQPEGIILRTASSGQSLESLSADVELLRQKWRAIMERADGEAPVLLHTEALLFQRIFRDFYTTDVAEIWVSTEELEDKVALLVKSIAPEARVQLARFVQQPAGILSHLDVQKQLLQSFERKVPLQSGGYIVIEHTEALTVIDVNTGKFVGDYDLEETMYKTNAEAAYLIARLLRLRDIGGIIIIDFIDMEQESNRDQIYHILASSVKSDRAKCVVFGWTKLGLMELTRKKSRNSYTAQYIMENMLK